MKVYVVFIASDETYYNDIKNQISIFINREEADAFRAKVISEYRAKLYPNHFEYEFNCESEINLPDYSYIRDRNHVQFIKVRIFEKEI